MEEKRITKYGLDLLNRSPRHYWEKYLNPKRPKYEPNIESDASHALILQPELFEDKYFLFDDSEKVEQLKKEGSKSPRLTNKYKLWKNEVIRENAQRIPLDPAKHNYYTSIQNNLKQHQGASTLLEYGEPKRQYLWEDLVTGAACECVVDWSDLANRMLVSVVFIEDASAEAFGRWAYKNRLHVEAAFCLDGARASEVDFFPQGFVWIAIEKDSRLTAVYYASDEDLKLGRESYTHNLEAYTQSVKSGEWSAYPQEIQPLRMPPYAYR